jgi:hypothetical protein
MILDDHIQELFPHLPIESLMSASIKALPSLNELQ